MKYFTLILSFIFLTSCATKPTANDNEILINTTSKVSVGNNYELKISKNIADSRCPEGVSCVWAGEVQLEIEIYKNQELESTEKLSINYKNLEMNKEFFAKYLPSDKKIKEILVLPAKNQDRAIDLKDYVLKIELE